MSSRHPAPLLHDWVLYVGYGRDLLVFDVGNHHLLPYIKGFITTGFKNNGFGLDSNRIDRLIIDRGWLTALTFSGANSRIIPPGDVLK